RADGRTEDEEVERRGDDRRKDALQDGAESARHLEDVDGADGVPIHERDLTRLTKISSSELSCVCRSLNSMPSSPSLRKRGAMVDRSRCASKVKTSLLPLSEGSRW